MEISQQNKELEYLDVFQEITRLISTVYDPQTLMDLVVRRLPELLEVDAASIRLLDRGSNIFVIGAAFGLSEEYLSRATIDTEEVMSQLMNGHPAARSDLSLKHDEQNCEYFKREGIKSSLSLPILHKDQVVGLIRLLTKEKRGFASHEISFAMSLAQQVGIGISNSRMYKEMQDQVEFLKELREISQLVNSTLDFDQIINAIVKKLPLVMNVKACTIRLLQPATNRLELVAASGLSKEYLERGSISRGRLDFQGSRGRGCCRL
jgi:two-component system NtrC family sensor kinase